jgi:hypothetical protein
VKKHPAAHAPECYGAVRVGRYTRVMCETAHLGAAEPGPLSCEANVYMHLRARLM